LYVLFVLNFFFFKPIMRVLRRREEMTVGKTGEAEEFTKQMEALQTRYDMEISSLKASLEESRHETIRRQRELADKKVQDARQRVERQAAEKKGALMQEYEKVRDRLPSLSESVAKEVVGALTTSRVVKL